MASLEEMRKMLRGGIDLALVEEDFEPNFGIDPRTGHDIFWRSVGDHYSFRLGGACAMIYHPQISRMQPEPGTTAKAMTLMGLETAGLPTEKSGPHYGLVFDLVKEALVHYRMNFNPNPDSEPTEWLHVENLKERGRIAPHRLHPGLRVLVESDGCYYAWEDDTWVDVDGSER